MTTPDVEHPRRRLAGRRTEMAAKLVDAVGPVVAVTGYDGLTVRAVAKAAGVSAASAYNYFASKEHLLAEAYWRRLAALPPLEFDPAATVGERVHAAVEPIALAVAQEPEFAAGVTTALLAHDQDVRVVRDLIGALMAERLSAAMGDELPDVARLPFVLLLSGGLLSAGMAVIDYRELAGVMARFADAFNSQGGPS